MNTLPNKLTLNVVTGQNIQSFKNKKRAIQDKNTGLMRTLTPGDVKDRMSDLENSIVAALYSSFQTSESGTDSGCLKQLRTALSGLSDDSLREIPEFSFGVEYVAKGAEGVRIEIEEI